MRVPLDLYLERVLHLLLPDTERLSGLAERIGLEGLVRVFLGMAAGLGLCPLVLIVLVSIVLRCGNVRV